MSSTFVLCVEGGEELAWCNGMNDLLTLRGKCRAGNKTHDTIAGGNDSTMGKLMEKAGGKLKKDDLVEKGHAKREAAGYVHEGVKE